MRASGLETRSCSQICAAAVVGSSPLSYFEIASQTTQTKKATVITTNTNAASPSMKVITIPQLERQHRAQNVDGNLGE